MRYGPWIEIKHNNLNQTCSVDPTPKFQLLIQNDTLFDPIVDSNFFFVPNSILVDPVSTFRSKTPLVDSGF